MNRSKAQRDRDRQDLLNAIDELGPRATTQRVALAMDSSWSRVLIDLRALERAGSIVQIVREVAAGATDCWVRAGSLEADQQSDLADVVRQQLAWEEIS